MKKLTVIAAIIVLAMAGQSQAYLLDDYFGVDLSVNGQGQFNMPWDPARGFMMHENWRTDGDMHAPDPGPRYAVSEAFDIEAMYLDFDHANNEVVYSIVTSMPRGGYNQVSWYPGYLFRAGDIRFNIGSDTYVVGTFNGQYAGRNYNTRGRLYLNPTMGYYDGGRGFGDRGNPILRSNSSAMTTTDEFYFDYTEYRENGQSFYENGFTTYLIEGRIGVGNFGGWSALSDGLDMTLAMSCNNDVATLSGAPVPEPATFSLLGLGLAGIIGLRLRKK